MGAKVVTITSGKGGVGKTTITANLSAALASQGQKVVCIDADIGLRNLDVVLGLENRIVYDLVDIVEGRCRLRQAMIRDKRVDSLYLIPAAQTRDKTSVSPSDMVRLCDDLRTDHDWIIIDSPAGIERGFRNAIAPADHVYIITNPEVSAVRDADRIIGLVEAEEKGPAYLIINRLNLSAIAFKWYAPVHYYPHWMEIETTLAIVFAEIWVFRWIVNRMPILRQPPEWARDDH